MSPVSSSGVGTLTVSKATLEKDVLLALIAKIISPLQIKIDVKEEKKTVPTELKVLNNTAPLTQRSAIVLGLCGAALLNQLDVAPYYLLGGHATPGSPEDAVALASISSWMSVASSTSRHDNAFYNSLDRHLETRAFLTPSGSATVADLDLALSIFAEKDAYDYPNLARWLRQCHATCTKLASDSNIPIPAMAVPPPVVSNAPVFFYEMEEGAMPKPPTAIPAPSDDKGQKEQQQQQQQQTKKNKGEGNGGDSGAAAKASATAAEAAEFDISALNIVVGKITKVWPHEEADKLFCEEIDIGEDAPRSIASGLRPFYKAEEMQGKMVLVLSNLKKRTMLGFASHGMVLCSSNVDHSKVEIVSPPEGTKVGERVMFEGFEGKDPEPENKVAKKKIFEKLAPDLKTTANGVVVWKDAQAKTSVGIIKGMPDGQVA